VIMDKSLICNYKEDEYPKQGETEEVTCCFGKGKIRDNRFDEEWDCPVCNNTRNEDEEMAVKLVDYKHEVEHDVEFGTCELCMSTGDLEYGVFVFEDESGERIEITNGEWSWGDWFDDYHIENIPRFADFFNKRNVEKLEDVEASLMEAYNDYLNELF